MDMMYVFYVLFCDMFLFIISSHLVLVYIQYRVVLHLKKLV